MIVSGQRVCSSHRSTSIHRVEMPGPLYVGDNGLVVHPMCDQRLGGDHGCGATMHGLSSALNDVFRRSSRRASEQRPCRALQQLYFRVQIMAAVAKVSPFHSKALGTTVHHNNDSCSEANDIAIQDRESGTGNLPLCDRCARLVAWRGVARRRE